MTVGRGFTLVEVLVVVLLVGLTASVVAPALARWAGAGAAEGARTLEAVYSAARAHAVERGLPVRVAVEPATGAYEVSPAVPGVDGPSRRGVITLGSGVRLAGREDGPVVITFDAVGRARGPPLEVTDDATTYEIAVDPWTAAVRVRRR